MSARLSYGLCFFLLVCGTLQAQRPPKPAAAQAAVMGDTSTLVDEIRRAEYRYTAIDGEADLWSAPNRAHDLRSRLSADGLEVFPRSTSADGEGAIWKLRLATTSFGRTDGAFALPPASVSATAQRVELDHGYLVEWFVNDERGIEQGWTIPTRPIGSGKLSIGLSIAGEPSLRIEEGGRSSVFVDACGEPVLRYRDLLAFDAMGRELQARLVPHPTGVTIEVDDVGAVYPLTVDPLLTAPAWSAEPDQAFAEFGASISTAGDVNGDGYSDVIVGARSYDGGEANGGRAYVYHGSASGLAANAAWMAEGDQEDAFLGTVSTAGDVNGDGYSDVIVGAYGYSNGETNEGRAYVYHGSASGLAATPAWTSESNQGGGLFGISGSTAGDVNGDGYSDVIIGGSQYDNGQFNEGRAFAYHGSPGGLGASPAWTAEPNQASAGFGTSVSTAGDVNGDGYSDVIVGAHGYDNGEADEGGAFVYLGSPSGLTSSPAWTAESNQVGAQMGTSVSTAGDVNGDGFSDVIVGAFQYDNGQLAEGRAYVYHGSSIGLSASAAWTVESDQVSGLLGYSVSTAGDVNGDGYSDVIVGAYSYDSGVGHEGRALAYSGSPNGLAPTPAWTEDSDQPSALFGFSVATAGDVNGDGYSDVIVGALWYDNGENDEGGAFAYHGSGSGLAPSPAWNSESNQAVAIFGFVSTAGDVNGDGYSDVIVGAPLYDNGQTDEGRAFLYEGSASGVATSPSWTAESDQPFTYFGVSVSTAGDVNGDGYSDVIVGAHLHDNGQTDEGRAYAYYGSASGLAATPGWIAEGDQTGAFFGFSVASAGDVNADGYSDVVVGSHGYDGGQSDEGRAYLFHGSPGGLAVSSAWSAEPDQAGASFGLSVSTAGDVNGDGHSDVIVGAERHDNGESNEGGAFVYHGAPGGLATSPAWTAESDQTEANFGYSVSEAGDVNGDGYSDVIVGAYRYDGGQVDEGRAYVYLGSASGLAAGSAWTSESDQASAYFGYSVSTAGDVNNDGYSDVIVGAVWFDDGEVDEGCARAFLGSASGLAASPAWTLESEQGNSLLGFSVSTAGDVNGDGYSDVIVGAPYYDNGEGDEGRAWVHLGNAGEGSLVRQLQQRTRNDARPLSIVGLTGESGLFRICCEFPKNATGTSWASPESPTAHLEWEVKPLGVAFDGTGIQSGTPQSLLPTGGTLTFDELVSIDDAVGHARTTEAQSYHWRARVATNSPLFPNTAWFSAPGSNVTEAKLRKPALQFP